MSRSVPLFFLVLVALAMMAGAAPPTDTNRALAVRPVAVASLGSTEKNWLVAIGVNQFKDKSVQSLGFCVADAQALYDFFTTTGFVPPSQAYLLVTGAQDDRAPTRVNILKAIKYVASNAAEDSTIIVHFSGHGFVDGEGRSYLLPEDGDVSVLEDTAVGVPRLNEMLAKAATKRKILIVDACRSEAGGKGVEAGGAAEAFIQALRASSGQVTMASCGQGEISYEMPEGGHGVYTHYFLEGLKGAAEADSDGLINLSSLQAYVARAVPAWCKKEMKAKPQQPWMSGEMSLPIPLAVKGEVQTTPLQPTPAATRPPAQGKRFESQGNRVFLDKKQGLLWYCPPAKDSRSRTEVEKLVKGEKADWRVATEEEMVSLAKDLEEAKRVMGIQGEPFSYWLDKTSVWLGSGETICFKADGPEVSREVAKSEAHLYLLVKASAAGK